MEGPALGVSSFARKEESAEMRVILFELIRWVTGANYHRRGAGSFSIGTTFAIILSTQKPSHPSVITNTYLSGRYSNNLSTSTI